MDAVPVLCLTVAAWLLAMIEFERGHLLRGFGWLVGPPILLWCAGWAVWHLGRWWRNRKLT
jgi:hypothetical protein